MLAVGNARQVCATFLTGCSTAHQRGDEAPSATGCCLPNRLWVAKLDAVPATALQAGGGVQLCPDALVDDGKLDVTYILNPNLEDVPKILTGLQSARPLASMRVKLDAVQKSQRLHPAADASWVATKRGLSNSQCHLQNLTSCKRHHADDKALEGPTGMLRCSWLEVDCPDELQVPRCGCDMSWSLLSAQMTTQQNVIQRC